VLEAALTSKAARRRHCLRLVVVLVGMVLCVFWVVASVD